MYGINQCRPRGKKTSILDEGNAETLSICGVSQNQQSYMTSVYVKYYNDERLHGSLDTDDSDTSIWTQKVHRCDQKKQPKYD